MARNWPWLRPWSSSAAPVARLPDAQLEPEDGRLWIYNTNDRATLGFTQRGIKSFIELSLDQKR
jgi:hypothetical protein